MSDDDTNPKPMAIGVAGPGWRVVYLLRKPPWVREEPIAAFQMEGAFFAYPMVRPEGHGFIQRVDKDEDYEIAAPGQPAEAFVEEAKLSARQHRAWLVATREKRKEEREARQAVWEDRRKAEQYEATGRPFPADHPAAPLLEEGRFASRVTDDEAARIGLAWFLAEHTSFSADAEVARDAFEKRLGSFLDLYEIKRPDAAMLPRLMQRVKRIETFKYRGKVDGWRGLSLRDDGPEEARPLDPDDPEARSVAATVFRAHCMAKAEEWQTLGVPQSSMLAAFRVWCIGFRLKPWLPRDVYSHLMPWARLPRTADSRTGERHFEGVVVQLPKPGQSVLRPGQGRGRRGAGSV